jgi:hypothetical protein
MGIRAATKLMCGAALAMSACAGKPRTPAHAPPVLQMLEQLPASASVRAEDVYSTLEFTRTFVIVNDDGSHGGEVVLKRRETDRHGGGFSDDEGQESEIWRVDAAGNVVLLAHHDGPEKAATHFRPPLVVMPPELRANQTFTSEAAMRVVDLNNPLKVREQGQARRAVAYMGDQRLRTARGEFTAQRLEIKFIADLKLADAEERTILFIVPGEGVVARQTEVTVKILGALSSTKRRTLLRVE